MAKNTHRAGDRKDGRLIRSISPYSKFVPFIMPQRNDRLINYEESFEITKADRFLRALRQDDAYKGIGLLHFIIAAYIRCLCSLPGINRFIAGRRIYARNSVEVIMTVKKEMAINAEETSVKVRFEPTDTIYDVYRKMKAATDEVKSGSGEPNDTDQFADIIARLPRFLIRFALTVLRIGDYFGWLPASLLEISPFHGSMIVTDLGSLRIGPVYHHIYNFGTLPLFLAFGAKYHKYEITDAGKVEKCKYIDMKMVLDEGICDGHYYAQFLQAFRYIFQHPDMLVTAPTTVREDIR